jgi:hypothetical protein
MRIPPIALMPSGLMIASGSSTKITSMSCAPAFGRELLCISGAPMKIRGRCTCPKGPGWLAMRQVAQAGMAIGAERLRYGGRNISVAMN